jgi:hypothetical protein
MNHLRQAPDGLPDGPAAAAAEVITLELVALLTSLRERITALETRIEQPLAAHADAPVLTSLSRSGTVRAATLLAPRSATPADGSPPTRPSPPHPGSPRPPKPPGVPAASCSAAAATGDCARPSSTRRRQPPGQPLGPGRLHPNPSPRAPPRPRRPGPGPRLAPRHLALLDRPPPYDPARHLAAIASRDQQTGTPEPTPIAS